MSSPPKRYAQIELAIDIVSNFEKILDGLKAWQRLSLIDNVDLRLQMKQSYGSYVRLSAEIKPELLEGLDLWLRLGIISQAEVMRWCGEELTCDRAESRAPERIGSYASVESTDISTVPALSSWQSIEPEILDPVGATQPTTSPGRVVQMAKSLVAEFSLVWLLFLGVFLVVVSSGVLAATQWDKFSPQGQYLILFAYTLAFWGVSFWTLKQGNLLLTTRTLQLVTLLIIPANFWAIDGLGLLSNPTGWVIGAIAGVSLSGVTVSLLRQSAIQTSNRAVPARMLAVSGLILLSWLHLGWGIRLYPAIAVYLGILSAAIATFVANLMSKRQRAVQLDSANLSNSESEFPMHLIAESSAIILLVMRALLFADVKLSQLGLAFGLCGAILHLIGMQKQERQDDRDPQSGDRIIIPPQANQTLGIGFLVLGWLVSVGETYPWQALIVSCLALWLLAARLPQSGTKVQLTAIFLLGLQTIALCIPFIPQDMRNSLAMWTANITQTATGIPILGVLLLPYAWLTLWLSSDLRSRRRSDLAQYGETLALVFGILLTFASVFSPLARMWNLLLSAATLIILERKPAISAQTAVSSKTSLIYLTHVTSLAAIASTISYFLPKLTSTTWIGICLLTMLAEWTFVLYQGRRTRNQVVEVPALSSLQGKIWADSSWQIGLYLAGLSYVMLLGMSYRISDSGSGYGINRELVNWGILWLVTPAALTFLSSRRYLSQSQLAANLSITALILVQVLTWYSPSALLISLGIATLLMLANIRQSEHLSTGLLTVGLGLGFIGALLWSLKQDDTIAVQLVFYTNGAAIAVLILSLIGHWLRYRRDREPSNLNLRLNRIYAQSFDLWIIPISVTILAGQTLAILPTWGMAPVIASDWLDLAFDRTLFSTVVIAGTSIYRIWQSPAAWATWMAAWSIELLVLRSAIVTVGTLTQAGIANLALGLAMQLLGDWWYRFRDRRAYPTSWNAIPLIYGLLGWLFCLSTFSAVSGLYSLAADLIGIGIGRREAESNSSFKGLIYLSLFGVTFSAYQLLVYQLFRSADSNWGDELVLMGSLSAAIALIYRISSRWAISYLKLLSREIDAIAHLHWFASAGLLTIATAFHLSQTGGWIGCIVLAILAIYAAWQGRDREQIPEQISERAEAWVYLAVVTGIGALAFLFYFAFPEARLIVDFLKPYAAAIACVVAYGLFALPWRNWGWPVRPWQRSAGCLPLGMVVLTASTIAMPSLLIVATFYAAISRLNNVIRLTYISLLLSNWALFRFYHHQNLTHSLWYVLAMGMSALYIIQVEPSLQLPEARETRHTFRLFATGSIGLTALLHSPSDIPMALVSAAIGIVFVLSGLALRVRAYLFVGTITFISVVLSQVWLLIAQYSFLIWAILIGAGITLILIVANFEARRDRMLALWQGLVSELSTWE